MLYSWNIPDFMDYLKKSLKKIDGMSDYEEIDTRLASGWYVDVNDKKRRHIKLRRFHIKYLEECLIKLTFKSLKLYLVILFNLFFNINIHLIIKITNPLIKVFITSHKVFFIIMPFFD